jgi:hypothetical protein
LKLTMSCATQKLSILREEVISELYTVEVVKRLCKGDCEFPNLKELLQKLKRLDTTFSDAKDDACVCFDKESIRVALVVVRGQKHRLGSFWSQYDALSKPEEKTVVVTVCRSNMRSVDLDTEENEINPQLDAEEQDSDPVISIDEHEVSIVKVQEPEEPEPTPYPLPPADAKPGYKTRVCTKMPKYNKLTTGFPCTFGKGCSYAHSHEEASFYRGLAEGRKCC